MNPRVSRFRYAPLVCAIAFATLAVHCMAAAAQSDAGQTAGSNNDKGEGPAASAQTGAVATPRQRRLEQVQVGAELRAAETELEHDAMVSLKDIQVTEKNGVVMLSGQVASLLIKQRAARIAETVRGVLFVENQLTIRSPTSGRDGDDLEHYIDQALREDPTTEPYQVTVAATPDGKVTLTGQVQSHAERELAGRVASGVRGVTALSNDIEVEYRGNRSDSELAADIRDLLRWDAYIVEGDIKVSVADGVAKLSGEVASAAEKRRVRTLVWMAGIKEVQAGALKVTGSRRDAGMKVQRASKATDENISAAVRRALAANASSNVEGLRVSVRDGIATLRGQAHSMQAKHIAERVAPSVAGIEAVRNRVRISSLPVMGNKKLRQRVGTALLALNPATEAYEMAVAVDHADVTLTGRVDGWFERGTASNVVAAVKGVRAIDNELIVSNLGARMFSDPYVDDWSIHQFAWYQPSQPTIWPSDGAIARHVRDELWRSPFVDRGDITVSVQNSVVTLSGQVDSYAKSRAAIEDAFEGGAASVVNKLRIDRPELSASDSD